MRRVTGSLKTIKHLFPMRADLYSPPKDEAITIIGLGSLMLEAWAKKTCSTLTNFRLGHLDGYKRLFNKTDSLLVRNNLRPLDSNAYACLSAVPSPETKTMIVSAFEISLSEWAFFVRREFEYRLVKVPFKDIETDHESEGVLCVGDYKNDQECAQIVHADPLRLERWKEFKEKYDGPMWRDDLLPDPHYLDTCLKTSQTYGDHVYHNFIDTTFIGDGRSIRTYLENT